MQTEFVVGLLQTGAHARTGEEEAFRQMLNAACANAGLEPPSMTARELAAIRKLADELLARFGALAEGGTMELQFPAPART